MRINRLLIGTILLLIPFLCISCGIPQQDYDAVVAEKYEAQAEVSSLQSELDTLESKLERSKSEVETLESNLAKKESEVETLEGNLDKAERQIESQRGDLALVEEQLAKTEAVFGKLLFFDDFEDGDTEGWDFGVRHGWSVIQEDNNYILQAVEQSGEQIHADIIGSYEWTDYTLEFKINFIRGQGFMVNFRATPSLSQMYILEFSPRLVFLHKNPPPPNPAIVQSLLYPPLLKGWNDIKIAVEGDNIKVYVNGSLKIDYTDSESLEMGGINLEAEDYSHIYLDNVLVTTSK